MPYRHAYTQRQPSVVECDRRYCHTRLHTRLLRRSVPFVFVLVSILLILSQIQPYSIFLEAGGHG